MGVGIWGITSMIEEFRQSLNSVYVETLAKIMGVFWGYIPTPKGVLANTMLNSRGC